MGKGPEWSAEEIVLLCKAWLNTSQDPIRGVGQKKATFYGRIHQHWFEHLSPGMDTRTEVAVSGRWKNLQPEVTKFEGIYAKLKSQEQSGWNEEKCISSAIEVYAERHKQEFEFLAAWKELRDKPKCTSQLTTTIGTKRNKAEILPLTRPGGQKAEKASAQRGKVNFLDDVQLRFVAASEKKASIMEQQLHFSIFMQAPESEESKAYFTMQRKAILAQMNNASCDQATVEGGVGLIPTHAENNESRRQTNTDIQESALL